MTQPLVSELGLDRPPQVIVAPSHDTAAAVAGVPAADDEFAFVCTGTWAVVGVELPSPVITDAAREAGFSNEAGVDGTTRFLRNVTGFWLLQECAAGMAGRRTPRLHLDELTRVAARIPGPRALIDVQDPAFTPPGEMTGRIIRACELACRRPPVLAGRDPALHPGQHGRRDQARGPRRDSDHRPAGADGARGRRWRGQSAVLPAGRGRLRYAGCRRADRGGLLGQHTGPGPGSRRGRAAPCWNCGRWSVEGLRLTTYQPEDSDRAWERADEIVLTSRGAPR